MRLFYIYVHFEYRKTYEHIIGGLLARAAEVLSKTMDFSVKRRANFQMFVDFEFINVV